MNCAATAPPGFAPGIAAQPRNLGRGQRHDGGRDRRAMRPSRTGRRRRVCGGRLARRKTRRRGLGGRRGRRWGAAAGAVALLRAATACCTSFCTSGEPPVNSIVFANPTPAPAAGAAPPTTRLFTSVRNWRIVSGRRFGLLSIAFRTTRSTSGVSVVAVPFMRRLGGTTSPFVI